VFHHTSKVHITTTVTDTLTTVFHHTCTKHIKTTVTDTLTTVSHHQLSQQYAMPCSTKSKISVMTNQPKNLAYYFAQLNELRSSEHDLLIPKRVSVAACLIVFYMLEGDLVTILHTW